MSMQEKALLVKKDFDDVYIAGKQKAENERWNNLLDVNSFYYRFAGNYWTDTTFTPTKDIKPTNAYGMFAYSSIVNLEQILSERRVKLDLSGCSVCSMMFRQSKIVYSPEIDISNSSSLQNLYYECVDLISAKIKLHESNAQTFGDTVFYKCKKLKELRITGGHINKNGFIMKYSPDLSKESIKSIFNALSDVTSGLPVTISLKAVDKAFALYVNGVISTPGTESIEWADLLATKPNWRVILADADE